MLQTNRQGLYELLWSTPMTALSRQFKVSDHRIARACDAHDIPRPPTGYWQKRAYNATVPAPPPLPIDRLPADQIVTISSMPILAGQDAKKIQRDFQAGRSALRPVA